MIVKTQGARTVGEWRLFNGITNAYLGLSGKGEVISDTYSWRGTQQQAQNLRKKLGFVPANWPYALVRATNVIWGEKLQEVVA